MSCSAFDTHPKLLDRAVSGARLLTGCVFERDIAHRRSVAVLCMLYKIRCNPMNPLNDALLGPYVPIQITRGVLVAHQYTSASPHCSTSQYPMTFVLLSVSLWNDLADAVYSMVWDCRVSRSMPMLFIALSCFIPTIVFYYYSLFLISVYWLVLWGWDLRTYGVNTTF